VLPNDRYGAFFKSFREKAPGWSDDIEFIAVLVALDVGGRPKSSPRKDPEGTQGKGSSSLLRLGRACGGRLTVLIKMGVTRL